MGDVRPAFALRVRARNRVRDMRAAAKRGRGRTCETRGKGTRRWHAGAANGTGRRIDLQGQKQRRLGKACQEGRGATGLMPKHDTACSPHDKT